MILVIHNYNRIGPTCQHPFCIWYYSFLVYGSSYLYLSIYAVQLPLWLTLNFPDLCVSPCIYTPYVGVAPAWPRKKRDCLWFLAAKKHYATILRLSYCFYWRELRHFLIVNCLMIIWRYTTPQNNTISPDYTGLSWPCTISPTPITYYNIKKKS